MAGYKRTKQTVTVTTKSETVVNFSLQQDRSELQTVIVTSAARGTDGSARHQERLSPTVVNVLSERAIQLSPDVTVANSLQRISGVSIERSSAGEGRYAIIRGMDQRYNTTLVNGIKIPSPDDRNRYVPMDIFPSDLLDRLEVIKSLTPNMEGDAIGGTMNLVMKSAPSKFLFTVFGAGGFNTLFNKRPFATYNRSDINIKDPVERNSAGYIASVSDFPRSNLDFYKKNNPINSQAGFTIGSRFLKDQKLGVVLGASYQNMYRGSDNIFLQQNGQPTIRPEAESYPAFQDAYVRQYSTQQRRFGVNNKWDYAFNKHNRISLFNMYLLMDEFQSRYTVDSSLAVQRQGPGSGNVAILNRSRWQRQNIYNSTLQGEHNLSNLFTIKWSAVYSIAQQKVPDQAEYEVDHSVITNLTTGTVTESQHNVANMSRIWTHNKDQDLAGYLNFIATPTIAGQKVELSTGGLYRHKNRDNYYDSYLLAPTVTNTLFTDIYAADYTFRTADGGKGSPNNASTYKTTEDISAGYLQANFKLASKLQLIGGVRVEHTDQNYETAAPLSLDARSGHIWYTDVLPSANLKYTLSPKQTIHAAYYKAITRPSFYDITPYPDPTANEYYVNRGNPELKHTRSDNFDVRYELFPGGADQVLIGGFYKRLYNPIEQALIKVPGSTGQQALMPLNFGTATNYGFEAQVTKYFGKFGVSANYTYTKSEITTTKAFYGRNAMTGSLENKYIEQTRPLQGQAPHIGNAAVLYKDGKFGLDVQVAFVYTGERILQVSPYYNLDNWQRPYNQLDFSFEKTIVKRFSVYGKINNLTNTKREVILKQPNYLLSGNNLVPFQNTADYIFVQRDVYKINYLFGLRYKM